MSLDNPIEQNPTSQQANQDADNKNSPVEQGVPAIAAPKVNPPPPHSSYKITCETKHDGWDYAKAIAEFIGLGFLIAYTIYTAGIYRANRNAADAAQKTLGEIQKQTTLIRQQLVGTMAAVVLFNPSLAGHKGEKLNPILENRGHVISPNAHIDFWWGTSKLSSLGTFIRQGHYSQTFPQLITWRAWGTIRYWCRSWGGIL